MFMMRKKRMNAAISSWQGRFAFAAAGIVILMAVASSFLFATELEGLKKSQAQRLDTGWAFFLGDTWEPIEALPCTIDMQEEESLILHREVTEEEKQHSQYVLALRSRYASVQVWADEALIYEAAQGRRHALGSMWHFIPASSFADAKELTIEFYVYGGGQYTVESILLDAPGSIRYTLLRAHIFDILFCIICLMLALLALLAAALLKRWKSAMYRPLLAFTLFLLLSGAWIILDSKITTINGGNYALSYFLSYAAFYLLQVPFLIYIRLITMNCRRLLDVLIWGMLINAGVSFVLHMTGLMQIQNTAVAVHVLTVISLPAATLALWKSVIRQKNRNLRFTFLGMLTIYVLGLISIALYYMDRLVATNSTQLYMVGLSILILGLIIDIAVSFGQFWKVKESADLYRQLAVEDSMTELLNRNAFENHLTALAQSGAERIAFVVFDVDDLKQINDQRGHYMGDWAIYTAARCIKRVFSCAEGCYRIGGDEFAVILTGKSVLAIPALLTDFQQEISLHWDPGLPSRGVSCGWAFAEFSQEAPLSMESLADLREKADRSLYRQKQERKKTV